MKSEKEIRLLLNKFYEGTSSDEDERLLMEFFAENDSLPDDLKADKEVFSLLKETADGIGCETDVPEGFADELSMLIDNENAKNHRKAFLSRWRSAIAFAASVCLILVIGIHFMLKHSKDNVYMADAAPMKNVYVPQTEEEAFTEATRALILVSDKLNEANDNVEYMPYEENYSYF